MNKNRYQYIITDLDTTKEKIIDNAPDNWAEVETSYERAKTYGTLLVQDTLSLKFMRDGISAFDNGAYYLISNALKNKGTKANIQIERKELNAFTNEYDDDFIGLLDLSADSEFSETRDYISAKTIDSGKVAKLLSRDEMELDVFSLKSVDGETMPDFQVSTKSILYKAIDLFLYAYTSGALGYTETFTTSGIHKYNYYSGSGTINLLGSRYQATDLSNNFTYKNNTESDILAKTIISGSYNISVSFNNIGTFVFSLKLIYRNSFGTIDETLTLFTDTVNRSSISTPSFYTISGTYSGNIERSVVENGTIEIVFDTDVSLIGNVFVSASVPATVDIIETYEGAADSNVRGLLSHEVISRGVQLTTSEADTTKLVRSSVLGKATSYFQNYTESGYLSNEFTTNGKNIRGFVSPLTITIRSWFNSMSARYPLGLWYDKINDIFVIEKLEYFFKNEQFPIHLGDVGEVTTTFATDIFYNSIKAGYPTTKYKELEGINEINAGVNYSVSISTKNIKDISSVYHGDSVGQELARKLSKQVAATQDTDYDNNVYITHTNGTETSQGGGAFNLVIAGGFLGIEQRYNLGYSPRQNLTRWQKFLSSILLTDLSEETQFRSADKSTEFSYYYNYQDEGDLVNESDNVPQELSENIIHGFWFKEFEAPCTLAIRNELKLDPHRIMSFYDFDGTEYSGYIWSIKINAYDGIGNYKLLIINKDRL